MATVEFFDATRTYPKQPHPAVDRLSMSVASGELVAIVGPSGSGKSTTLRMLAGLEPCDRGAIRIGDRDVTALQTRERNVAMVFQTFALYPHMSVAENMAFALKMTKMPAEQIKERVLRAAEMLDLTDVLNRLPKTLSGGQRQRVAMGRAVVREPDAFLMDEPLSNLDAQLRHQTRMEVTALQRRLGTTMLYVTHDQTEAMTMGDRVAVLDRGVLQQFATPQEVYDRPESLFVATFIGTPRMNILEVPVAGGAARVGQGEVAVPRETVEAQRVMLGVRPEDIVIDDASAVRVRVERVEIPGADTLVYGTVAGQPGAAVTVRLAARAGVAPGDDIGITIPAERLHLFDVESGRRLN
ncbi:MAG: ABC transporter ATP-binding protein [Actinomycetales bacterium]|nr:ABC transporter ATP-binding protein [Actinomycetales bacterium]